MGIVIAVSVIVLNVTIDIAIKTAMVFCMAWAAHRGWRAGKK